MKAAVVRELGEVPRYEEFPDPAPGPSESIVEVSAAALTHLALSRAAGAHYSADAAPPLVVGVDGVGRDPEGRRVYFARARPPYGALAERAPVPTAAQIPLPPALDDVTVAAAALPGMSCWRPLTVLAPIRPNEAVLVHGAAGASGRMAVQVAKHLGASRVIAAGRDPEELRPLRDLGADELVVTDRPPDELRATFRTLAREAAVGVVLDYLWGPTAEALLEALGGPNAPRGPARVRYVQVGSLAGPTIRLESALLRSSGVELLGSGLGSASPADLLTSIRSFLDAMVVGHFRIETEVHPLAEVARFWGRTGGARRRVFSVP